MRYGLGRSIPRNSQGEQAIALDPEPCSTTTTAERHDGNRCARVLPRSARNGGGFARASGGRILRMRYLALVFVVACGACTGDAAPAGPPGHLTVMRLGAAAGFVESDPPGILCGGNCDASFPAGTVVTLFAEVGNDGTFSGWDGACSGTEGCTVMIDGEQTVSATFPCTGKRVFNYEHLGPPIQTLDIPHCASHVIVEAAGAQGGNAGGLGAKIQGTFATHALGS